MRGAVISECGKYRYRLWRIWDEELPRVLWIMLNPSTADADVDDATIRKIVTYTKRWGFGGVEVCNLYSYRATDPKDLPSEELVIGPDNDKTLRAMFQVISGPVVVAWGANASDQRTKWFRYEAMHQSQPLYHLGLNKNGSPKHPLYLRADADREEWLW